MISDKTNNANDADDKGFTLQEFAMTKPELFDQSAEFKATIEPRMDALSAKCKDLGIPFFAVAAYGQDEIKADYHAQAHMPSAARVPHLILAAHMAGQGDFEGVQQVLIARHLRGIRNQQTTH